MHSFLKSASPPWSGSPDVAQSKTDSSSEHMILLAFLPRQKVRFGSEHALVNLSSIPIRFEANALDGLIVIGHRGVIVWEKMRRDLMMHPATLFHKNPWQSLFSIRSHAWKKAHFSLQSNRDSSLITSAALHSPFDPMPDRGIAVSEAKMSLVYFVATEWTQNINRLFISFIYFDFYTLLSSFHSFRRSERSDKRWKSKHINHFNVYFQWRENWLIAIDGGIHFVLILFVVRLLVLLFNVRSMCVAAEAAPSPRSLGIDEWELI